MVNYINKICVTANSLIVYYVVGIVRRRCIRDDLWEEFFECFREETRMLLDQVNIAEFLYVVQNNLV